MDSMDRDFGSEFRSTFDAHKQSDTSEQDNNELINEASNSDNVDEICEDTIAAAAAAASSADGVSSQELGNYLQSYMGRRAAAAEAVESGGRSVYDELRQKEQDLLLAAELGRALLCSNAQLKEEADMLRTEFEARLSAAEREKLDLRSKIDSAEQDWDAQIRDLQAETRALREEIRRQQLARSELMSANERLVEDCRLSSARADSLQSELRARRAEAQDRLASAGAEINELRAERADMERRLSRAGAERDALAAAAENQRVQLEARLAELTDTVADLREQLAASLASQRRQQMELAEEQLFQHQQQQQQMQMSPLNSHTPTSCHVMFMSSSNAAAKTCAGDSGVGGFVDDFLGESLFSELGGLSQLDSPTDGRGRHPNHFEEDDEEIEEDEQVPDSSQLVQCTASSQFFEHSEDEQLSRRQWEGPCAESMAHLVQSLQSELQLKSAQLEEKNLELQQTKNELIVQQRQTEALLASESALKRDQRQSVEKRICLESQLSQMKAEVERLNSELNIGGTKDAC